MRVGGVAVAVAVVLLAALSGSASAFTAAFVSGTLTVTGAGADEAFTVSESGANVVVTGPAPGSDPDGAGTTCTASGNTVQCTDAATSSVVVNAGIGADTLKDTRPATITGPDFDSLNGEAGNDTISYEGSGLNTLLFIGLNGGTEDDTITKNGFFVTASGGDGQDTLNAGSGSITGADSGGPGNDTFHGNPLNSDLYQAEEGADTYDGGAGGDSTVPDSVNYALRTAPVTVTIDDQANDGADGEGDNVQSTIEGVTGGGVDDHLTGNDAANSLVGGPGNDVLAGAGGDDVLNDGDSTPTVSDGPVSTAGNDQLDGGAGDDTLYTDRGADDIHGGSGFDTAVFSRPITQTSSVTTPVQFFGFVISLDDVANDGARDVSEGDNVHTDVDGIVTGAGSDSLTGSAAAESFNTGDGADTIVPGAGPDVVSAGPGDDNISAVDSTTDRVTCGGGTDTASLDLAGDQPERADVAIDCENVSGTPFPAVVPASSIPDTAPPTMTFTIPKHYGVKAFLKSGVLTVSVLCSESCGVTGEVATDRAKIAKVGELSIGSGKLAMGTGNRKLKLKVAKRYLKPLSKRLHTKKQRRKGITLIGAITAKDAAGNARTARKKLVVRG